MANLLAKQDQKPFSLSRGQEVIGEVVAISSSEIILDLGTKSEGVLLKKELPGEILNSLKNGDKLPVFVVLSENESGQVALSFKKSIAKQTGQEKWERFEQALNLGKALSGKIIEVNKGGLIVEVGDLRGFLPTSLISLSKALNLEDMVGQEINVVVIEVDPNQNRLIFSQKAQIEPAVKEKLGKLKVGDKVSGKVAAILPFGIFVELPDAVEGLVHISEISWEKVEDPGELYKVGDTVEAQIISVDSNTNRANLSVKRLQEDPFVKLADKYSADDVTSGAVTKVTQTGILITLESGIEGLIPQSKLGPDAKYEQGQEVSVIIDSVDLKRRRITLSPFVTTTKGLIYK